MQSENGGRHHIPHIHCIYGDFEVILSLDGDVIEGEFPKKQLKYVEAWVALHEEELRANWDLLSKGEGYFKIDPLR